MKTAQEVLDFWFGPLSKVDSFSTKKLNMWFTRSDITDRLIKETFGETLAAAERGALNSWTKTVPGRLALVVLLDQFSRNIHRNTPGAFANDPVALELAKEAVLVGDDLKVLPIQRVFFYLPYEHSENLNDQNESVQLFTELLDLASPAARPTFESFLDYARRHRDVILKFGRFPHRNSILGRVSTPEEEHYLAQPGSGF